MEKVCEINLHLNRCRGRPRRCPSRFRDKMTLETCQMEAANIYLDPLFGSLSGCRSKCKEWSHLPNLRISRHPTLVPASFKWDTFCP